MVSMRFLCRADISTKYYMLLSAKYYFSNFSYSGKLIEILIYSYLKSMIK